MFDLNNVISFMILMILQEWHQVVKCFELKVWTTLINKKWILNVLNELTKSIININNQRLHISINMIKKSSMNLVQLQSKDDKTMINKIVNWQNLFWTFQFENKHFNFLNYFHRWIFCDCNKETANKSSKIY